jgi:hypothetical protein
MAAVELEVDADSLAGAENVLGCETLMKGPDGIDHGNIDLWDCRVGSCIWDLGMVGFGPCMVLWLWH